MNYLIRIEKYIVYSICHIYYTPADQQNISIRSFRKQNADSSFKK